jgi:hypothetical protein
VVTGLHGFFSPVSATLCLAGIAGASLFFVQRATRNLRLYANMTLYAFFFSGSLVMLFLVIQRHGMTYDATRNKLYSLSQVSKNYLHSLTRPVRVTAFVTEADKDHTRQLLGQYAQATPKFSFQLANPFRDVGVARRFGVSVMPGDVYVETLTTGSATTDRVAKIARISEEDITNGIVQVLRARDVVLYFLAGHDELPLERETAAAALAGRRASMRNLSWVREQLERSHVKVRPLQLSQRGRVPADASAVISVAPKTDLSGAEKEALERYLDGGGKAVFLLNADLPQIGAGEVRMSLRNLGDLLEEVGILLPREMLARPVQTPQGGDHFSIPVQMLPHGITQIEGNDPLVFTHARPVLVSRTPPEGIRVEPILLSTPDAISLPREEIATAMLTRKGIDRQFDVKDLAAHTVAVVATRLSPDLPEEMATRVIVIGNGDFVSTERIDQKGWLLFNNAVGWATHAEELVAVPSTEIENTPVLLTDGEKQFLFLLMAILIPAIVGLLGVGYTIAKREIQ